MKVWKLLLTILFLAVPMISFQSCLAPSSSNDDGDYFDEGNNKKNDCDPWGDDDGDNISNGDEGCAQLVDTDMDGRPDYQDADSDNDGLPDWLEAGDSDLKTPPEDADGDGVPNFRDPDSDNDGVRDGDEDRNHDGLVGHCKKTCVYGSENEEDQCGQGQVCLGDNTCAPYYSFECAEGETDPYNPDTDGDGIPDGEEGTFVCNPSSEDNPHGRRPVVFETLDHVKIGIEAEAEIARPTILDATGHEELIVHDLPASDYEVAGFTLTMDLAPGEGQVEDVFFDIRERLVQVFGSQNVKMRASGAKTLSHEKFPTMVGAIFDITVSPSVNPAGMRNQVVQAILGKSKDKFQGLPDGDYFGPLSVTSSFVLSFAVQIAEPKDPTNGQLIDRYVVVQGGVVPKGDYENTDKHSSISLYDLSNSTGFARPNSDEEAECETYIAKNNPVADIVWVIDESGSMSEEQQSVADNAVDFFNRAITYGLDFRMAVVDVNINNNGVFCTGRGVSGDYFLGPADLSAFQACVLEPWGGGQEEGGSEYGIKQGEAALLNHLPRQADSSNHFRPEAEIVLIYASDERDETVDDDCGGGEQSGMANVDQACVQQLIQPTLNVLLNDVSDRGVPGKAHAIIGPPPNGCDSADEVGQGYLEVVQATGGIIGSICQSDLGPTLQLMIDDIVASASPVVLKHVPISLSLAASKDGVALPRSRKNGFDYRANTNTIIFLGQQFDPAHPSEIVVSYHRWVTDVVPID